MTQRLARAVTLSIFTFSMVLTLMGCATPTFRSPAQFQTSVERLKTVAFIPPYVKVYSVTAGGVKEEMEEWSAAARDNLVRALENQLATNTGFAFSPFKPDGLLPLPGGQSDWTALDEIPALYKAVSTSVFLHTYDPNQTFVQKVTSMEINHHHVVEVKPGDNVALKVTEPVRVHDVI